MGYEKNFEILLIGFVSIVNGCISLLNSIRNTTQSFEVSEIRVHSLVPLKSSLDILRASFAFSALLSILLIFRSFFGDKYKYYFISQLNDRSGLGTAILVTYTLAVAISSIISWRNDRPSGAIGRGFLAIVVVIIISTDSGSLIHLLMYFCAVITYSVITVFTFLAIAMEFNSMRGTILAFAVPALIFSLLLLGPTGQRCILIFFLLCEVLNIYICSPKGLYFKW